MHDSSSLVETLQNSLNPSKHLFRSKSSEDNVSEFSESIVGAGALERTNPFQPIE